MDNFSLRYAMKKPEIELFERCANHHRLWLKSIKTKCQLTPPFFPWSLIQRRSLLRDPAPERQQAVKWRSIWMVWLFTVTRQTPRSGQFLIAIPFWSFVELLDSSIALRRTSRSLG
jgi:hypothetical protein